MRTLQQNRSSRQERTALARGIFELEEIGATGGQHPIKADKNIYALHDFILKKHSRVTR